MGRSAATDRPMTAPCAAPRCAHQLCTGCALSQVISMETTDSDGRAGGSETAGGAAAAGGGPGLAGGSVSSIPLVSRLDPPNPGETPEWVGCDTCKKYRRLPFWVKADSLGEVWSAPRPPPPSLPPSLPPSHLASPGAAFVSSGPAAPANSSSLRLALAAPALMA